MGDGLSFFDCTDLQISEHVNGKYVGKRKTGNPLGIKNVITLCPIKALAEHYEGIEEVLAIESLKRMSVNWMYFGKGILDGSKFDNQEQLNLKWSGLVHDCTKVASSLTIDVIGLSPENVDENLKQKQEVIQKMQSEALFTRAFEVLDRAVFDQEATLVHCAQGVSRSTSVVIAWLIRKFGCTAKKATAFVRSKRPCVEPRFPLQLKKYAKELRAIKLK